jgi:hypothetical protein
LYAVIGEQHGELAFGEVDVWAYEGKAGEVITIRMLADNPTGAALGAAIPEGKMISNVAIFDPAGEEMHKQWATFDKGVYVTSDVYIEGFVLPEDGIYLIKVKSTPVGIIPGGYTLVIERAES